VLIQPRVTRFLKADSSSKCNSANFPWLKFAKGSVTTTKPHSYFASNNNSCEGALGTTLLGYRRVVAAECHCRERFAILSRQALLLSVQARMICPDPVSIQTLYPSKHASGWGTSESQRRWCIDLACAGTACDKSACDGFTTSSRLLRPGGHCSRGECATRICVPG